MEWYWYALIVIILLLAIHRSPRLQESLGIAPFIRTTKKGIVVRGNHVLPEPPQIQFGLDTITIPGGGKRKVNINT